MHIYIIYYIDGDQRKKKTIQAATKQQAVYKFYQTWRDCDYIITTIKEDNKTIYSKPL